MRMSFLLALMLGAVPVAAQTPTELKPEGKFVGEKADDMAKDLSGIACMPPGSSKVRHCLVINDQNRNAQFADIEGDRIVVGRTINLIGSEHDPKGPMPTVSCPEGKKKFKDLDGEGVAYAKPYFYVVGSHGCSRKNSAFRASSFILARVHVDEGGRVIDANGKPVDKPSEGNGIETTYRLAEVLKEAETVKAFYGKKLQKGDKENGEELNGLNVEGIVVLGDEVFVGLRAPSLDGNAYIVRTNLADLFASGKKASKPASKVIQLALGKKEERIGIRDLATRANGSLVVLAGPAQEQDLPYNISIAEPHKDWKLEKFGSPPCVKSAEGGPTKAEGLVVLDDNDHAMEVLVVFDGLPNGGPRRCQVK